MRLVSTFTVVMIVYRQKNSKSGCVVKAKVNDMDRFKFRALFKSFKTDEKVWFKCMPNHTINHDGYLQVSDWLQCTGLKDKNGVLIYEGDILNDQHDCKQHCVILWEEDKARFCYSYPARKRFESCCFNINKADGFCNGEVIGNIYENPELLEQ